MKLPHVRADARRQAGFSLLETMIALTLLSLLTVLALSTLNVGARVWNRFDAEDSQARAHAANIRLRDAFDAMVLPDANALRSASASANAPPFSGGRFGFEFTMREDGVDGGYYGVRLAQRQIEDGAFALELTTVRLTPDRAAPAGDVRMETLITDLAAVEFSYLGLGSSGQRVWRENWADAQRPPRLTRIIFTLQGEARSAGAPLVFAPGPRSNAQAGVVPPTADTD